MRITLAHGGLFVLFRFATDDRKALGFVIKLASARLFSERHNGWRGFKLGPLYFRTFTRRPRNG